MCDQFEWHQGSAILGQSWGLVVSMGKLACGDIPQDKIMALWQGILIISMSHHEGD